MESELKRRGRAKLNAFIIAEASALGLLLLAGTIAVSARFTNSTIVLSINVITIVAAAAVALIPIIFFAIRPVLPRER